MASLSCFSLTETPVFLVGLHGHVRHVGSSFYVYSCKFQRRRDVTFNPSKQVSLFFRCFEVEVEGASSSGMLHGRGLLTFAINT